MIKLLYKTCRNTTPISCIKKYMKIQHQRYLYETLFLFTVSSLEGAGQPRLLLQVRCSVVVVAPVPALLLELFPALQLRLSLVVLLNTCAACLDYNLLVLWCQTRNLVLCKSGCQNLSRVVVVLVLIVLITMIYFHHIVV